MDDKETLAFHKGMLEYAHAQLMNDIEMMEKAIILCEENCDSNELGSFAKATLDFGLEIRRIKERIIRSNGNGKEC